VQVYVRDEAASVTQPVQSLRGFRRLTLGPGEHETVTIRLGPEAFRIWNDRMEEVTEPGTFRIMAGGSSAKLKSAILEIIAPS
jgi:beta-glucosidase